MTNENFRKLETTSGKIMLAGKNAENNEKLVGQAGKDELILHTATPGSPFVNIKLKSREKISKEDVKEAAIFCVKYSQAWKKSKIKKDIEVHVFKGKDIYKTKGMSLGTFGVKNHKSVIVKSGELEK
ncbi:MAG: NFACT RNA binding domain-containing protein [Candidatus Pacearchaeota archaeon]|nr:NFACT RNA binding domain-containing protein [Candidatus Pacearchaeota archaeon]